jgi:hypothetical protein
MAELIWYARRGGSDNRDKRGVFIGIENNNVVRVGWSICNVKAGQIYKNERALQIARGRAEIGTSALLPKEMKDDYTYFMQKVTRRFKGKEAHVFCRHSDLHMEY